jgi:hypothetical protein
MQERNGRGGMGNQLDLRKLWTQAITLYETTAKIKLDDSVLQNVNSVDALLETLEVENGKFADFRSRNGRVRDVVKSAMGPVDVVSNALGGAVASTFPPAAYVFAGVRLLVDGARGVSERYDGIVRMMLELKVRFLFLFSISIDKAGVCFN